MVIGDEILGTSSPYAQIYDPSRLVRRPKAGVLSVPELASEAAVTTRAYVESVSLRSLADIRGLVSPASVEDIAPGPSADPALAAAGSLLDINAAFLPVGRDRLRGPGGAAKGRSVQGQGRRPDPQLGHLPPHGLPCRVQPR